MHRLIVTSADLSPGLAGHSRSCSRATRGTSCSHAGRGSGSRPRWSATSPWRPAACSNPAIGGPSVFPPQPDGVTSLAYGQTAWPTSTGADRYRRGLYTYHQADGAVRGVHDLRRPDLRDRLRPPRAVEHAAPGADAAQRHRLRRGLAGPGPAGPRRGARPTSRTASGCAFRLCLAPAPAPTRRSARSSASTTGSSTGSEPAKPTPRKVAGPCEASPTGRPGRAGRVDDRGPGALEPRRDDHQGVSRAMNRPTSDRDRSAGHTRRHFFRECGVGLGKIALASLLVGVASAARGRRLADPLAPRPPHFAPKAKRVIYLFMAGAPSQLDLFDHKPTLRKYDGKPVPAEVVKDQRYAFIRPDASLMASRFKFAQARPVRGRALGDAAPPGEGGRRHRDRQVDAHRPVQPRPGADLPQHRLAAARPAEHGVVGHVRPGQRGGRPARLRRALVGRRDQRRRGELVAAASCRRRTRASRSAPRATRSSTSPAPPGVDRAAPARVARPDPRPQPAAPRRRGRPRDRHPDHLLRDGLPDAVERPGADGPLGRDRRRRWPSTAPSRASRRSPTTACWPAGWSSAGSGSSTSTTRAGTTTPTSPAA